MRNQSLAAVLVASALTLSLPAQVTDWFVDAAVPGPGTGTKTDPFRSLTQAATAATDDDRIFVAPGTYSPTSTGEVFTLTFGGAASQLNLKIIATGGPAVTILDGLGTTSGNGILRFRLAAAGSKLCGFTLLGYAGTLGAIRLGSITAGFEASNVEICHCVIRDAAPGSGIATFGDSDQLKIHDNWIINCADNGLWLSDITCNTAAGGGGEIWNNTIVGCGHGMRIQGGTWRIMNNIIALSTIDGIVDWGLAGTACTPPAPVYTLDYNCYSANVQDFASVAPGITPVPAPNDVFADPLLANPLTGDLHIAPASPCRNAGNPVVPAFVASDFDGDPRILAGPAQPFRPEIGADEVTDVRLTQIGPASLGIGFVGFDTTGPPGESEFKAFALNEGNVVLPGIGNVLLDLATLTIIDPVPNVINSGGSSLLGVPLAGVPPTLIGLSLRLQAVVFGAGGTRLTNSVLTLICP